MVGCKILIYAKNSGLDKQRPDMQAVRNLTREFFVKDLGFDENLCIEIDVSELPRFNHDGDLYFDKVPLAKKYKSFSDRTRINMARAAEKVFERIKKEGLSRQVLTVAVTEVEDDDFADVFFKFIQNFELNIAFNEYITVGNATKYFKSLRDQMENEQLTQIEFGTVNSFFKSALALGIEVSD